MHSKNQNKASHKLLYHVNPEFHVSEDIIADVLRDIFYSKYIESVTDKYLKIILDTYSI